VEVDQSRIAIIVFGRPLLRDRDEEEVRGYRQALIWIHDQGAKIPIFSLQYRFKDENAIFYLGYCRTEKSQYAPFSASSFCLSGTCSFYLPILQNAQ
jgi:hypothetical protein